MQKQNPFRLTKIIPGEPFCNRKKEIEDIRRHISNGSHLVMYAPRRMGKSSVILEALDGLDRKIFMSADVDLFRAATYEEFIQNLYTSIVRGIGNEPKTTVEKLKQFIKGINPTITFTEDGLSLSIGYNRSAPVAQTLDSIISGFSTFLKANGKSGVLFFDEFQQIHEYAEGKDIEKGLRSILQDIRNVVCIFAGSETGMLKAMFNDKRRAFYGMTFNYTLDPISQEEFVPYIIKLFDKTGKSCTEEVAHHIYWLSAGYPYYVQKLSHIVWDFTEKKASMKILNLAKKDLLEQETPEFFKYLGNLTMGERKVVLNLMDNPTDKPYSTEILSKHGIPLGTVQKAITSLQASGLIVKDRDNIYRVTDPLLLVWHRNNKLI